jgi:hypothetical protein
MAVTAYSEGENMLKVFGHPNTRSARVVWALEEIGVDYDYIKVDLFKGEGRKPPYLDLNPGGKVPKRAPESGNRVASNFQHSALLLQ